MSQPYDRLFQVGCAWCPQMNRPRSTTPWLWLSSGSHGVHQQLSPCGALCTVWPIVRVPFRRGMKLPPDLYTLKHSRSVVVFPVRQCIDQNRVHAFPGATMYRQNRVHAFPGATMYRQNSTLWRKVKFWIAPSGTQTDNSSKSKATNPPCQFDQPLSGPSSTI